MKYFYLLAPMILGLAGLLSTSSASAQNVEAGRTKAQACAACHGADGNSSVGRFPTLAGQTWRYI